MIEEPYRWLEAIANRREYVREQLKGGSPVFGLSLEQGILLFGLGMGQSKVFEIFDRHAMAALGHPADIEKMRQASIDVAHMEAFTRASEDVTLKRLVSFGLSPQLKTNFEQIFSAPILVELLLAEVGTTPKDDLFVRLHFDGSFELQRSGISVVAVDQEMEKKAGEWLQEQIKNMTSLENVVEHCRTAWTLIKSGKTFSEIPDVSTLEKMRDADMQNRELEIGFLDRHTQNAARYRTGGELQLSARK